MEQVRVADADAAVLMAIEMSKASWLLAVDDPPRTGCPAAASREATPTG
jgi:hypothetical protein